MSLCFVIAHAAEPLQLKPALAPLAYFEGEWECSGKFDASGKVIEAHEKFSSEMDGSWIFFQHDDKSPFAYHALAEWGWNDAKKQFVMTVQDSAGGVRQFQSTGWNASQIRWDGDALGSAGDSTQRFDFERLDERHFKVSYFMLKKDVWSRVDSITCSKQ